MAEIWVLNEEPVFSQEYLSFDAVFTTDNIEMDRIEIKIEHIPEIPGSPPIKRIRYTQKALNGMVPNIYIAYDSSTRGWDKTAYRTLIFEVAPTGDLLTWLQANGTKQDNSKKITKLKYKASDFCQLMDKSKYPTTREIAGITFTNNGDGSFAMSGTKNGNAQLEICVADIKKGHKYLGTTGTDIVYMWFFKTEGSHIYGDFARNPFYTATETDTNIRFFIKTDSTDEINVTVKPQLFDLTEMYGSGNEPTTLAEFRQKYPNDLYPYSLLWYSINKTRYMSNRYGNSVLTEDIFVEYVNSQKFFYIADWSGATLYKRVDSNVIPKMGLLDYKAVSNGNLYDYISNDKTVSLGYPGMYDNFIMVRDLSFNGNTEKFKQFIIGNNVWFELETPAQGGYLPLNKGVKL